MSAQLGKPTLIVVGPLIFILIVGCKSSEETDPQALRQEIARLKSKMDRLEDRQSIVTTLANKGHPGIWELNWNDTREIFEPRILKRYPQGQATPKNIMSALNGIRAAPGVDFVARRGTTVYLRIKDAEMLTQRMGTTGARTYLGFVTISLTSAPSVDLVHFDFLQGDHANPGFYSQAAFLW